MAARDRIQVAQKGKRLHVCVLAWWESVALDTHFPFKSHLIPPSTALQNLCFAHGSSYVRRTVPVVVLHYGSAARPIKRSLGNSPRAYIYQSVLRLEKHSTAVQFIRT
ncbi:hypothetical protein EVAR_56486_1 [Eumeta japonica]|uniref:Uncharacterized protein n=1 Tax=Eumeta variegata TaxID=151549 RepID=A0A4C1XMD7_EUMVA|nr:hypothetical protein EVAR_56486_1 [Eumeta japonica]